LAGLGGSEPAAILLTRLLVPIGIPIGLASLLVVAGCKAPPDLESRGNPVPVPSVTRTTTPPFPPGFTPAAPASPLMPSPSPSISPFPLYTAVACGSKPTADQVINLVRGETPIRPSGAITGPLCAGTWHFTVLRVPDREPVEVVTRDSLKLVAVGTDVCTAEVKLQAPAGIQTAADC
jgi:hypothetical protein